jgi:hypothetical protein
MKIIIPLSFIFFAFIFTAIGYVGGMKYYQHKEKEYSATISNAANIISDSADLVIENKNREIELYKNLCHSYEERIKVLEKGGE